MVQFTRESFEQQVLNGKGFALVEFWAPWCVYCRRIAPAFEKTAEENAGKLLIGQVNIDEVEGLDDDFEVDTIPTFLIFRDGQPGERLIAPGSKAALDEWLAGQLKV